jgi:putative acetyltransferase
MTQLIIRPIEPRDDEAVASIIREVMPAFGAGGAGFAIHDTEVGHMSRAYAAPGHAYFVVEDADGVVGGGGIAPLAGTDDGTCELRKMYFLPRARGRGAGRRLIERCLETARALGYRRCYLETLTGMDAAQALYTKVGFTRLPCARGSTGHHGCDRHYQLELAPLPVAEPRDA